MATVAVKVKKEVSAAHDKFVHVRKGRVTDFWEKNPIGLLTVMDRRAVLK